LYGELTSLEKRIEFCFTDSQVEKFLSTIRPIRTDIIDNHSQSFISNLHRHGLILFRIAMILTVLRNTSTINKEEKLFCSNKDFLVAMEMMKTLLSHCQFTFNSIESGDLSIQDETILEDLNTNFTRKKAIEIGLKHGIPQRTIDDKLVQWQKRRLILKQSIGKYKKRM
jgi:hypothetical protein